MNKSMSETNRAELTLLRELSARVGSDPLLTQASTGNSSMKIDGLLWIKASGKWMADALRDEILIGLDLKDARQCLKLQVDPAERYADASIETAMHAVLPHRVVVHVHCVNTIAWAVRQDAPVQLERRLNGLRWKWISHVRSGLPLAREIERSLSAASDTNVLVLGNHGLVIGGDDCRAVANSLSTVRQRLAISPRLAAPIDYACLRDLAEGSSWDLPDDDAVHALGTDPISRSILSGGLLHPCQSILSNSSAPGVFHPVPFPSGDWESRYRTRSFLVIEGCGVIVRRTITLAQREVMRGIAQIVQRISSSAPLRYLAADEVANSASTMARYLEAANTSR